MLSQMLLLRTDVVDVTCSHKWIEKNSAIDKGTHKEQMCMSVCVRRTGAPVIIISEGVHIPVH